MLKSMFKPIEEALSSKFEKSGLKRELLKHPDYVGKAKEIWDMIDQDFGISKSIENILKLKTDKFNQILSSKFPELTQDDITKLKESVTGELNSLKDIELNKIHDQDKLKDLMAKLQEEIEKVKERLAQLQSTIASSIATEINKTDTTDNKDEK
jgi:hypothetical protein